MCGLYSLTSADHWNGYNCIAADVDGTMDDAASLFAALSSQLAELRSPCTLSYDARVIISTQQQCTKPKRNAQLADTAAASDIYFAEWKCLCTVDICQAVAELIKRGMPIPQWYVELCKVWLTVCRRSGSEDGSHLLLGTVLQGLYSCTQIPFPRVKKQIIAFLMRLSHANKKYVSAFLLAYVLTSSSRYEGSSGDGRQGTRLWVVWSSLAGSCQRVGYDTTRTVWGSSSSVLVNLSLR